MKRNIDLKKSSYFFVFFILIALLGFWKSYFGKLISGNKEFSSLTHFHFIMVAIWLAFLIVQPFLIKKKEFNLHKFIGKLTYVLIPLLIISVVLLSHSQHSIHEPDLGLHIFLPFKDILLLVVFYFIAIKYKKNIQIHARAMVATGIIFIEPALVRLIENYIISLPMAYIFNILIVYTLIGYLIYRERMNQKGMWVFPLLLGLYILVHTFVITQVDSKFWIKCCNWFIELPLT